MKRLIPLFIYLHPLIAHSQIKMLSQSNFDDQQELVLDVVLTLLDGMREADSSKVHSTFRDNPQLYTSYNDKEGKAVLRKDDGLQKFLNAVGTPHDQVWDEPIWNIQINIDGNLASVWTEYAFYAGKKFSHCGVDAFMLNKEESGWKIFQLTDTRRSLGCQIPNEIKQNRE
jgi:hypothetical protein